jgi:hypothetical protein
MVVFWAKAEKKQKVESSKQKAILDFWHVALGTQFLNFDFIFY